MFHFYFSLVFVSCLSAIFAFVDPVIKPKTENVMGGFTPMDVSNMETLTRLENVTKFAMKELNAKSNDLFHQNKIRIVDAKKQVVAGTKYVITLYNGQTTCAKNQVQADQVTRERCPLSTEATAKFNKCEVTVWEKPWENFMQLLNDKCTTVARTEAMGA